MPVTNDRCTLLEIPQDLPGFNGFIGSWVYRGDLNLLVDVGPANSVSRLIDVLVRMGVDRVDYILLTHIHIDHAGGLAACLEHFPMAQVVCHEKGIKPLVYPEGLWNGSRKVLGPIAEAYGEPHPVEEDKLIAHTEANVDNLVVVDTPGHAAHHVSFSYGGHLFPGEAMGNYYAVQNSDYLRPATPPRFFYRVFLESLERLRALEDMPVCYAHWGHASSSHQMLDRFEAQLVRWKEVIGGEISAGGEDLVARSVDRLLDRDPDLKAFHLMDPYVQRRERSFLSNSVKGYMGFLLGQS
jgi:glyoxylase-like metal-dependent hydrolase (beta-lactamase superfamily II)